MAHLLLEQRPSSGTGGENCFFRRCSSAAVDQKYSPGGFEKPATVLRGRLQRRGRQPMHPGPLNRRFGVDNCYPTTIIHSTSRFSRGYGAPRRHEEPRASADPLGTGQRRGEPLARTSSSAWSLGWRCRRRGPGQSHPRPRRSHCQACPRPRPARSAGPVRPR